MASRIQYSVSVTPVFTHSNAEGPSADVVATDFAKTFGGSGVVSSPTYGAGGAKATVAHTSGTLVSTPASCKGLFVRHTGVDENDAVTAATVTVTLNSVQVAILEPGGAFFLPSPVSSVAVGCTPSAGQVKLEYAVFV